MSDEQEIIREPKPVNLTNGFTTFIQATTAIAVICGGFWASSHLAAPRRLSGATRSSRLKWERAHAEMQQAIRSADDSQTAPAGSSQ